MLTIWEKYGYSPLEWKQFDKQDKMDLLAKLILDNERDKRLEEENSD